MPADFAHLGSLVKVHHLNCGRITLPAVTAVTHVLACEYQHGVVLVDVGIGRADAARPLARLGVSGRAMYLHLRQERPAIEQLGALGFTKGDVAAIVATHLDFDHVGAVSDFPDVPVLMSDTEWQAATTRPTARERMRYRTTHLADLTAQARPVNATNVTALPIGLSGVPIDAAETLWLAPLVGHTRGHSAIVVRTDTGWLVHAGDAFFSKPSIYEDSEKGLAHRVACGAEQLLAMDRSSIERNHQQLKECVGQGALVICSHDQQQFKEFSDVR